jgi:PTH1 family peptidyl-tRNA hydrolase
VRLIVGLGNPGTRYARTLHNAGFQVCDRFADRNGLPAAARRFQGEFRRGRALDHDVGVLKPQTYMNLSGESVAEALRYLPVEIPELLVVYDDMDIPAGQLRLRKAGGHGGHNGMRSLIEALGSSDFPRLRVGIGRPDRARGATSHVLGRPAPGQDELFARSIERATEALEAILRDGLEAAMNRYNRPPEEAGGPALPAPEEGG